MAVEIVGIYWFVTTGSGGVNCTLSNGNGVTFITNIINASAGHTYKAITSYRAPNGTIYKDNSGNYTVSGTTGTEDLYMYSSPLNLTAGLWTFAGTEIYQDGYLLTWGDGKGSGMCENLTILGTPICNPPTATGQSYCDSSGQVCEWDYTGCVYSCYGCPTAYECVNGVCQLKTTVPVNITQLSTSYNTSTAMVTVVLLGTGIGTYIVKEGSSVIHTGTIDINGYDIFVISNPSVGSHTYCGLPSSVSACSTFTVAGSVGTIVLNSVEWVTPSAVSSQIKLNVTTNGSTSTYLKIDADVQQTVVYSSSATSITTTGYYPTNIAHSICIGTPTPTQCINLLYIGYNCANCSTPVLGGKYSTSAICMAGCTTTTFYSCDSATKKCVANSGITVNKDGCSSAGQICGTTTTFYSCDSATKKCVANSGSANTDGCSAAGQTCGATGTTFYSCDSVAKQCVANSSIIANKDGCSSAGQTCAGAATGCTNCPTDVNFCIFGQCVKKNNAYIAGGLFFLMMMMK